MDDNLVIMQVRRRSWWQKALHWCNRSWYADYGPFSTGSMIDGESITLEIR